MRFVYICDNINIYNCLHNIYIFIYTYIDQHENVGTIFIFIFAFVIVIVKPEIFMHLIPSKNVQNMRSTQSIILKHFTMYVQVLFDESLLVSVLFNF